MKFLWTKRDWLWQWLLISFLSSALGVIVKSLYSMNLATHPTFDSLMKQIISDVIMLPMGVIFALFPIGAILPLFFANWFAIALYIAAVHSDKKQILYGAYFASFIFGILWPYYLDLLMSV